MRSKAANIKIVAKRQTLKSSRAAITVRRNRGAFNDYTNDICSFLKKVRATGALTDHCETIKNSNEWQEMQEIWKKEMASKSARWSERDNDTEGVGVGDVGINIDENVCLT